MVRKSRQEINNSENYGEGSKFGAELDFAATEAYNLLRTNLLFSFTEQDKGKIIGITSPAAHEGKSTTAINLAYSLAEAGQKVILVDADMRKPTLAKNLNKPISPGLSNFLVSRNTSVMHNGLLHENLSVVMAGDIPPNPSELLGSTRMEEFLNALTQNYDYVIVDLPPVTAVSDPLVVSKYLGGIIIVMKHNTTRRSDILETIRQLKFTGVRILGFVYNMGGQKGGGYYNKYGYRRKGYYSDYGNGLPKSSVNGQK